MTLEQIINYVEIKYPEWDWLIRKDLVGGYFANIYSRDAGKVFPSMAGTSVHALQTSLAEFEEYIFLRKSPPAKIDPRDALIEICHYLDVTGLALTSATPNALAWWKDHKGGAVGGAYNKAAPPPPPEPENTTE